MNYDELCILNDEHSNQMVIIIMHHALIIMNYYLGGLAQLARAPALQAGGQRFESVILHEGHDDASCIIGCPNVL